MISPLRLVACSLLVGALAAACATTGAAGEGGGPLPSAGVGPFRELEPEEVRGLAPYVLDDAPARYREPAVLRDGSATLLYAVARVNERDVIVRTRANDERTFFGTSSHFGQDPAVVLEPEAPWEVALSGPTLLRFRGEVLLYYAGAEGIGLARSADGRAFTKVPGPVLARDLAPGSWETTAPRAPSVYVAEDGATLRMLYASGDAIGEAESTDGVEWRRRDGPVLAPSAVTSSPDERPPFDAASVSDPCVVTRRTPGGRFHVRVLYTGTDAAGASAIGFAARYGDAGPLERSPAPVYSARQRAVAPALLDLGDLSFLYVEQDRPAGTDPSYPAIAAAVAPATVTLPPPADFPDAP